MSFRYEYKCDQCGEVYELDWRPEVKYGENYKQMCGHIDLSIGRQIMCRGTLKRVYSTFSFRMKGEMGR